MSAIDAALKAMKVALAEQVDMTRRRADKTISAIRAVSGTWYTAEQAIYLLRDNPYRFFTVDRWTGERAYVEAIPATIFNRAYLKTVGDDSKPDNLLSLPYEAEDSLAAWLIASGR